MTAHEPTACTVCGRQVEEPPVTWTRQVDERGVRWLCEQCTRQHLRAIESRLSEAWW